MDSKALAIETHDLAKSYQLDSQRVDALQGVNLRIPGGTIAALIGRSGAGKSTLLHLLGTLEQPSSGRVLLNGEDVSLLSDYARSRYRSRYIGFVFQSSNLLPEFSALENVMMPALIAGEAKRQVKERAMDGLSHVGLAHRTEHRPAELSGGEQQRVAIARALLMAPPLLLADEPTGNLDRTTSHGVQDLLLQLCVERNMTMLLVTHDLELANRLPNQIVMEDGRLVERG